MQYLPNSCRFSYKPTTPRCGLNKRSASNHHHTIVTGPGIPAHGPGVHNYCLSPGWTHNNCCARLWTALQLQLGCHREAIAKWHSNGQRPSRALLPLDWAQRLMLSRILCFRWSRVLNRQLTTRCGVVSIVGGSQWWYCVFAWQNKTLEFVIIRVFGVRGTGK